MNHAIQGQQCPIPPIDEEALKRAIAKAKEVADANPARYRRVHSTTTD